MASYLFCSHNWQGEEYKLIWPDHQEFVRMAARFGATIVPFGCVGEDDIVEVSFSFPLKVSLLFLIAIIVYCVLFGMTVALLTRDLWN